GTVTWEDGSATLATSPVDLAGNSTFMTSSLAVGSHPIVAVYSGNNAIAPGTSSVVSQTVNADSTTTTVASSQDPSIAGQSLTFTATVGANSPGSGTPTGTVTFEDGPATLGTAALDAGDHATFSTSTLSAGTHSITAVYG